MRPMRPLEPMRPMELIKPGADEADGAAGADEPDGAAGADEPLSHWRRWSMKPRPMELTKHIDNSKEIDMCIVSIGIDVPLV